MNWQAISFDWNQVRAFLATVEERSFSGAARALRTTQPTVGRQVSGLEEALGITLFERTVRGPILTEAGQGLLDHVRTMGEAATLISMAASGSSEDVSGEVSVTASDLMASTALPRVLVRLRDAAPAIRIRVIAENEVTDLSRRDADIAIRNVRPHQPDLIARHIGDFRANFYAATPYLDRFGRPRTTSDMAAHAFVGIADVDRMISLLAERGIAADPGNVVAATGSGTAMWEMTRAGHCIAILPEALGEPDPGVEKALPSLPSMEFPVWLVTHRELRTSRRIRVVFDTLAKALRDLADP